MTEIIVINSKNARYLHLNYGWKGKGTKDDQIVIDSHNTLEELVREIRISSLKIHIKLENCDLKRLVLEKCENMIINSSKIDILNIKKSSNISIHDSTINFYVPIESENIKIEGCDIYKDLSKEMEKIETTFIEALYSMRKKLMLLILFVITAIIILLIFGFVIAIFFIPVVFMLLYLLYIVKKQKKEEKKSNEKSPQ